MANNVFLDAMIMRADFGEIPEKEEATTKIVSLSLEGLKSTSYLVHQLRKPDFQRETNHWTPLQVVTFLKSFLDRELVPSIILWQSPSHVFVIDGGHRLSALRAWIEDDYGEGPLSRKFYKNAISASQQKVGDQTRKLVEREIGKFSTLERAVIDPEGQDHITVKRAKNMVTRSVDLQWVEGDAARAESSFFKINTQGTPLNKTEEMLLRNRIKPSAISARAIVRAGTGNKYWLQFGKDAQSTIEEKAKSLYNLLFEPEIEEPIKTLELPIGGTASKTDALELLMNFIAICNHKSDISDFTDDLDGSGTISALDHCIRLMSRISSNDASSLGLHPAVYFYNEKGKHSAPLFLAIVALVEEAVRNNNKGFFKKFTQARKCLEDFLVAQKSAIGQAIILTHSTKRVEKLKTMIADVIDRCHSGSGALKAEDVFKEMGLKATAILSTVSGGSATISTDTKSAILIRDSLAKSLGCPICGGRIDASKSLCTTIRQGCERAASGKPRMSS